MKRRVLLQARHYVLFTFLLFFQHFIFAAPNCRDMNCSVDADGKAKFKVGSLLDMSSLSTVDYVLRNQYGATIDEQKGVDENYEVEIDACVYLRNQISITVTADGASCMSMLTFKAGPLQLEPAIGDTVVWCYDPILKAPTSDKQKAQGKSACGIAFEINAMPDWVQAFPCDNDTAKIVYRMWEGIDKYGQRTVATDTIVALKLPELTAENFLCPMQDTVYCAYDEDKKEDYWESEICEDGARIVLPKIVRDGDDFTIDETMCDTICMTNLIQDTKCSINVKVKREVMSMSCPRMVRKQVSIIQLCSSEAVALSGKVDNSGFIMETEDQLEKKCDSWITYLDTLGPIFKSIADREVTLSIGENCTASGRLPNLTVIDNCSGVKFVKAYAPGVGSTLYSRIGSSNTWEQTGNNIVFEKRSIPQKVYLEAFDSCHVVSRDSIEITTKDNTSPTVVMDRDKIISLNQHKTWVDAEAFNSGSTDNCGVGMILARRMDWDQFCIDLCSKTIATNTEPISVLGDETDRLKQEVELHYMKTIQWLKDDGEDCGPFLARAWEMAIRQHWANSCGPTDAEGNPTITFTDEDQKYLDLGGGWSKQVPFGCEDACKEVKVELLVMDKWCNWSKSWGNVTVESSEPAEPFQILENATISCMSYKKHYKAIVEAYDNAADTDAKLLAEQQLDAAFGTYKPAWENEQGQLTDINGNVLNEEITIMDRSCKENKTEGNGEITYAYEFTDSESQIDMGYYGAFCDSRVEQDLEPVVSKIGCEPEMLIRTFTVHTGCGAKAQTTTFRQQINIEKRCKMSLGMFDLPAADTVVCQDITSAELDPGLFGGITLKAGLEDSLCIFPQVSPDDKPFDNKIVRTWTIIDWCSGDQLEYEQHIIKDANLPCPSSSRPTVSGDIMTETHQEVSDVFVKVIHEDGKQALKKFSGEYSYELQAGEKVKLRPYKDSDHDNGVSVSDLVFIHRVLVNKAKFRDKYQFYAADVDRSGEVNTRDLIDMKRLILNKTSTFPHSPSWRFFHGEADKESITFTATNTNKYDFMAVKIGDVNLSNNPSRNKPFVLTAADRTVQAGEKVQLKFKANEAGDIEGWSYNLDMTNFKNVELISDLVPVSERDYYLSDKGFSHTWVDNGIAVDKDQDVFTLVFEAKTSGKLSDLFRADQTEIVINGSDARTLSFEFISEQTNGLEVYANRPNPVDDYTVIPFRLAEDMNVDISVYDISGRRIYTNSGAFQKGHNEIKIDRKDLSTGMLYYRLEAGTHRAVGKMMVLD